MTRKAVARLAALVAIAGLEFALLEGGYRLWLGVASWSARFPDGVFEVYAVGESSARGWPYGEEVAFPVLLARMFDGRISGRRIEVRNLAESGSTVYRQTLALRKALRCRNRKNPGAVLVYAGHNERLTRLSPEMPPVGEALRQRLVYPSLLLSDVFQRLERMSGRGSSPSWQSHDFYFRSLIEESRRSGAIAIVGTVAGNNCGVEPNVAGMSAEAQRALSEGLALEDSGRLRQALKHYRMALGRLPSEAILSYRLARCLKRSGDLAGAKRHYREAVEADPRDPFGRTTARQNQAIARVARELSARLVDAAALFEEAAPHGLLGDRILVDAQHPDLDGQGLLAAAFAKSLSEATGEPLKRAIGGRSEISDLGIISEGREAQALTLAGRWLIQVSRGHPRPEDRLVLARRRLEEAARLKRSDEFRRAALRDQTLGRLDKACPALAKLARGHPGYASFLTDLAVCESLAGNRALALAHAEEAVRLRPEFLPARRTLAALRSNGDLATEKQRYLNRNSTSSADPMEVNLK